MKINVYFKQYYLGYLQNVDEKFVYTSNLEGEEQFRKNAFSSAFYTLFGSNKKVLSSLPSFLKDYLNLTKNPFFVSQANIEEQDDNFVKLFKLAGLKFDDIGFYISQK